MVGFRILFGHFDELRIQKANKLANFHILHLSCFLVVFRDHLGISTRKDKILSWGLIGLAVFSDLVAIYSNAVSLL